MELRIWHMGRLHLPESVLVELSVESNICLRIFLHKKSDNAKEDFKCLNLMIMKLHNSPK